MFGMLWAYLAPRPSRWLGAGAAGSLHPRMAAWDVARGTRFISRAQGGLYNAVKFRGP